MRSIAVAVALLVLSACGETSRRDAETSSRTPREELTTTAERSGPQRPRPRVVVRTRVRPYEIAGSTESELEAAMRRLGPKDPADGTAYAGYTRWTIEWSYGYTPAAAGCTIQDVRVVARIRITLPRWRGARKANPLLAADWGRFIGALRLHEDGHAAIARAAARRIARRLASVRMFRSCARLERAADAAGQRMLAQARAEEIAYDRRTGHGYTQGARLPL